MKSFGRSMPVSQYDLQGLWIRDWDSIKEAANELGIQTHTISRYVCKKSMAGSFQWAYKRVVSLEGEIWGIYPLDRRYKVSNLGRIISPVGKLSQITSAANPYLRVRLVDKSISIHRMVAETFIENPENKPLVNHINGNKTNNSASNLSWVTKKECMQNSEIIHK